MYCYSDENEKTISLNPNSIDELELFKKNFLSCVQLWVNLKYKGLLFVVVI